MGTLLVMTGVVTEEDLEAQRSKPGFQPPDYVMQSFGGLLEVEEVLRGSEALVAA